MGGRLSVYAIACARTRSPRTRRTETEYAFEGPPPPPSRNNKSAVADISSQKQN
ncbi:hypothetical protein CYLTODRAFT_426747 [Cylindrobasidium torrendii FP15055 ss-10]|uniref:Uncharacterized protein n=1 Tax=Cylindrobasidium torrendii FP15055 ss-10 TaxID=1314674 RepID=A0A0D7AZE3_9AGAR|nr:hypothetical protein CYLTODRAFT_426747 [Cylindrobasidium torrendii FP15055 ss-10]